LGAQFRAEVDFSDVNFSGGGVDFGSVVLSENAYFWGAKFRKDAYFEGAKFGKGADFHIANFSDIAVFRDANFSGWADFTWANFSGGDAYFILAEFGGYTDFIGTQFSCNADFNGAEFSIGDVVFTGSQFSGYANFSEAKFRNNVNFGPDPFNGSITQFRGAVYFVGADFYKEAYFNDAHFNGTTSFNSSWFKEDALFENTTFKGELSLTRTRYNKLLIRWDDIKGGLTYDDTAYLTLLKNFKDLGYLEDHDRCYFDYRRDRRSQTRPQVGEGEAAFKKVGDLLLEWFYGYGTKPLNALFFSLGIVIGFGAFWRSIGLGRSDEALDEYSLADAEHDSILEVLAFSATVFLSGTRLFIEPPPLPKIRGRSRSLIRGAFIFERVLGALFSILFFLAISGTVVRQL